MHNFQQLFKDDDDNDGEEDYLNFLRVLPSSIYSALLIFNEVSPSSHASDFLRSSLAPLFPPMFHPIHFCCCIDDDEDDDDDDDDNRP